MGVVIEIGEKKNGQNRRASRPVSFIIVETIVEKIVLLLLLFTFQAIA